MGELLENIVSEFVRDSLHMIGDRNPVTIFPSGKGDLDPLVIRRKFGRVRHQVGHNLHQAIAVAHSIGLEHTDNPAIYGTERPEGPFVLEENMVVSFDMLHHEFGWAHMHLEDTLHITKDGCVPLTDLNMEMVVLPA